MLFKIRNIVVIVGLIIMGWLGLKTYSYFFDTRTPNLQLSGLEEDQYYCGDLQCLVSINKPGEISAWLDNKPLLTRFKVGSTTQEHPFAIPTRTVANGKHALKLSFIDNTFRKNRVCIDRTFFVDNVPLQAAFVRSETDYKVLQGRTLHLQFQVNKKIKEATVYALSNSYPCFPESENSSVYEAFIPVHCEEIPNEYPVALEITDKVGNNLNIENKFQVIQYPFKKQVLHVGQTKLAEEKKLGKDPKDFEALIDRLTQQSPQQKLWRGKFCMPTEVSRVTCDYGTIRTSEEKGKYQHKALDLINQPKSMVWASQSGIVVLKERFEHSGNTVVIDHGWGILSMYFHLDSFANNIEVNQKIAQGNPVGRIGQTGYASGYHLHWELRVNNMPVDPLQWTTQNF
jgi:murein DD-endopeptidase MepM/ murein hydrolase activator NlpD